MTNLYDTLGVAKNASADEIKKAYRKLAREHHPDASGGDEARFKEIQGAYDVLSDDEKRKAYDAYGSTNGRGPMGGGPQFQDFDLSDLGDLFGGLFGGGGGGFGRQRGPQAADCTGARRRPPDGGARLLRGLAQGRFRCRFAQRSRPPATRAAARAPSPARRRSPARSAAAAASSPTRRASSRSPTPARAAVATAR